ANINYPVIADTGHEVSGAFDVLLEDGAALRGTFIIDPEGILRHMSINELDVGRNVNETLRVLQALRTGELCPVDWKPGQSTLTTYYELLAMSWDDFRKIIESSEASRKDFADIMRERLAQA